jgi:surface antigen
LHPQSAEAVEFVDDYPSYGAADHRPSLYEWWVDENGDGRKQITDDKDWDDDETMSPRGYFYKNCTDGAAYWTQKYTGVDVRGWGNATYWDTAAGSRGYAVKAGNADNIEPGDIAQNDTAARGFGHVGFVTEVNRNAQGQIASIKVAELNKDGHGEFSHNSYAAGSSSWDHFIDVNDAGKGLNNEDLANPTPPRQTGNLLQAVNTGSGWGFYNVSAMAGNMEISGKPGALWTPDGPTVFAADGNGALREFTLCNNGLSWCNYRVLEDNALSGGVDAVQGPNGIEVFGPSADGSLQQIELAGAHWAAYNISASAGGIKTKGAPGAFWDASGPNVFAVDTSGTLRQFTLCPSGGNWCSYELSGSNEYSGGATVVKVGSSIDVFARSIGGHLYQVEHTLGNPWRTYDLTNSAGGVAIVGAVGAYWAANGPNLYAADASGRLRQWTICPNGGNWCTYELTQPNAVADGVDALVQGSSIEVFATTP